MSVEAIVKRIISEEADQERRHLLAQAREEARGISLKIKEEIDRSIVSSKPIFEQRGALARARIVHQAEFEAQTKNADEKQKIVQAFLAKASAELAAQSEKPDYKELLKQLIQEALPMVDRPVKVLVRSQDLSLTQQALKELGRGDLGVVGALKGWGGIRLESLDGTISLDNTLESRFHKALEVFKEEIGKDLFA